MNALSAFSHIVIFVVATGIIYSIRTFPAKAWLLGFFGFYLVVMLINVATLLIFNSLDTSNEASLAFYQRLAFVRNCLEAACWVLLLRFMIICRRPVAGHATNIE